ncbi:MAG: urea transporter [Alistipes senegalensis]
MIVSTVTGYILGFPARDGEQGLWGFNGVLVGCAFPRSWATPSGCGWRWCSVRR